MGRRSTRRDKSREPLSWRHERKTYKPNTGYHLTARRLGNLFHDARDYAAFESILARLMAPTATRDQWGNLVRPLTGKLDILAYCLMPTHVHLVVWQYDDPRAIAKLMQRAKRAYGAYYRDRYGPTDDLYEGRYRAELINDPAQITRVIAYVHANPVDNTFAWRWSGHGVFMARADERRDHWLAADAGLRAFGSRGRYLDLLHQAIANKRAAMAVAGGVVGN